MTTTSSHMASNFEPHNVMSANVGITVKQNGQSLRTNSTLTILKKRKKSRMKN